MPIVVQCECGKKLKVPDEGAGRSVRCPACQGRISVPAADMPAGLAVEPSGPTCPACGSPLQPGAVICLSCGHDLRTGRRAGGGTAEPAPTEAKSSGRYPHTGLTLVYWGSRAGFSLVTATMGFGLLFAGFWLVGGPGVETSHMAWLMLLGVIFAGAGIQVGAKGYRVDWLSQDDDMDFEEMLLARGAPSVAGLVAGFVWVTGNFEILFGYLLPLGLIGSATAIAIGLTLCLVMSPGAMQKLLALGSALGYLGGAGLVLLTPLFAVMGGLGVVLAAVAEVCFLLWLRGLGRRLDFEAAIAHVARLLLFDAVGGAIVAVMAVVLSGSIQEALKSLLKAQPVFGPAVFAFYLCGLLYVTTATVWRLKIMRALLDEIEVTPSESSL